MLRAIARGSAVAALAAAVALAAPAGAADADKAKSRVRIKRLEASGAAGHVSSKRAACEGERKVTLFTYDGFISTKVKITHSKENGKWRVRKSLAPGRYFAKVDAAKAGGVRCLYDVSPKRRL